MATDEGADDLVEDAQVSPQKQETCSEMLSRHRREIAELQKREVELKKTAAKGSKAEQKARKKQVDKEISELSAQLKERHNRELASLGYHNSNENDKNGFENLVNAVAGVSCNTKPGPTKPGKSLRRRDRRAQRDAAREQRIQQEQSGLVTDQMVENCELQKKLGPLHLRIQEIKPDGHCLYRAVEHQLAHLSGAGSSPYTYQQLREMVAAHMRARPSDFMPFFLADSDPEESDGSVADRFEKYCKEIESSCAWGGQLELEALTHCLQRPITVFMASSPDVKMGEQYGTEKCITLSYHKHAFTLGEHYNSVMPILLGS